MSGRVFISSTFEDLKQHRLAVIDILNRIQATTNTMEFFGAQPDTPVSTCLKRIGDSDLVLVILAHRYGWVPNKHPKRAEYGDGEKSITELEIDHAIELGKPVFVFIVDDSAPWPGKREQDRLLDSPIDDAMSIARAVDRLKALKARLRETFVCDVFSNPDDLAKKAAAALHQHFAFTRTGPKRGSKANGKAAKIRMFHPLTYTPPFVGRDTEIQAISSVVFTKSPPQSVLQIIASGGSGKTSLLARWLEENAKKLETRRGVTFVWSFYTQPDPDGFLRACSSVFLGKSESSAIWRPEAIARRLADGGEHLLIIDGLDALAGLSPKRSIGEIDHPELRDLFHRLGGGLGSCRALFTSRIQVANLTSGTKVRTLQLSDLPPEPVGQILASYGVVSAEVLSYAQALGGHALSTHVVGSFVKSFGVDALRSLDVSSAAATDQYAAKLGRILEGYALGMSGGERDLLATLSSYPVFFPIWPADTDGTTSQIPRTPVQIPTQLMSQIRASASALEQRGLVQKLQIEDSICLTAHPFVREFFRPLLGLSDEDVRLWFAKRRDSALRTSPTTTLPHMSDAPRYSDFFYAQISLPDDEWIAPYTAWCFNIVNRQLNAFAVDALAPKPSDVVVDAGFGGGIGLRCLLRTSRTGKVIGLEASGKMLSVCEASMKDELESGRLEIVGATLGKEKLPFRTGTVDKILCVNTLYFVAEPDAALVELNRILKRSGKLILGFETKASLDCLGLSQVGFKTYDESEALALLASAGFYDVKLEKERTATSNVFLVSGLKKKLIRGIPFRNFRN